MATVPALPELTANTQNNGTSHAQRPCALSHRQISTLTSLLTPHACEYPQMFTTRLQPLTMEQ